MDEQCVGIIAIHNEDVLVTPSALIREPKLFGVEIPMFRNMFAVVLAVIAVALVTFS